jgi:RHS repeat-associated protein
MKIKHSFLLIVLILNIFINVFAQSQDQNYIKSTEYLEPVLIESDFSSSFGGWLPKGSVDLSLDNGRLKANVNGSWEGVKHLLNGFVTTTDDVLNINITFDKGNTQSDVRIYFAETDPNGNLVNFRIISYNMQTGTHQYSYTMVTSGNSMSFHVDKTNTNVNSDTYFFIDYISLKQGGVVNSISKLESLTYFDGFGKAKQTIGIKQTSNQKDILQHVEYDQFGRASKQYLAVPTTQNSGNYVTNPVSQITNYFQTNFSDQHPFSESRFDDSPLNRVLETSSPGNAWELLQNSDSDHTTKFERGINELDEVYKYDIDENNASNPLIKSFYPKGQLLKNITKNVNWNPSDGLLNTKEVFIDKNGRIIAEFSYENSEGTIRKLSTYNVYDDKGNLRYVLTPKMFAPTLVSYGGCSNYNKTFNQGVFSGTVQGAGSVNVNVNGNQIQATFNANFSSSVVIETPQELNLPCNVPDMLLGSLTTPEPYGFLIKVYIINGQLKLTSDLNPGLTISGFNCTLTKTFDSQGLVYPVFDLALINNLAFQYKYDQFNRQIEQKVPGKDWEYMVYDQLDRPILTQDANLREQNKWLFNKYDVFGRVVYSGLYTNRANRASSNRASLQTHVDNLIYYSSNKANIESRTTSPLSTGGIAMNYSNNAFPNSNLETLNVIYFDDYNFTDSSLPAIPTQILGQEVTNRTKGLLTASWSKVLGTTNSWSKHYTYYNKKGQVIYIDEENYLGGYTRIISALDFRGKVTQSITAHKRVLSDNPLNVTNNFEFDHVERPTKHYQKINTQQEELISNNTYDELGQLQSKKVGGSNSIGTGLQTINYTYNIKGWLTELNNVNSLGSDLFAYSLNYVDAIEGNASVSNVYNGNIKQVIWKSAENNLKKAYAFEYDKLNRFTKSIYRENIGLTIGGLKFSTSGIKYDSNGNITKMNRWGESTSSIPIDYLTYSYDDGNKLLKVTDGTYGPNIPLGFNDGNTSGDDYLYDANGNIKRDFNKGIYSILYNHLDLVTAVYFNNGKDIKFTYDANGNKLQMKTTHFSQITTVDYLGGFQHTNSQLQFFPTAEGYAAKDGSVFKYVYIFSDHLGNNRLSYHDVDGGNYVTNSEIQSNTDYYPMGLIHNGQTISGLASNYNYKYQGKEQLNFSDYNMYDFGSRMYDAAVGRWFNTDPQNQFHSPYLAMANNPVMVVDPDGELAWFVPIIAGAVIGGASTAIQNPRADFGDILGGAGLGAAQGAFTSGIGTAASGISNLGAQALVSAGAHGAFQGIVSSANGGNFLTGFAIGAGSSLVGSATSSCSIPAQIGAGGLSGGLISELSGGNFGEGFTSGLMVSGLNHAIHRASELLSKSNGIVGIYGAGGKNAGDNPTLEAFIDSKGGRMKSWFWSKKSIARMLKRAHERGNSIEIYGYSRGGQTAVAVANLLGESHVYVSKLVLFDAHTFGPRWGISARFTLTASNVRTVHSFYQRNPLTYDSTFSLFPAGTNPFWGSPVTREYGNMTNIYQHNLTGHYYKPGRFVDHINIVRYALKNYSF